MKSKKEERCKKLKRNLDVFPLCLNVSLSLSSPRPLNIRSANVVYSESQVSPTSSRSTTTCPKNFLHGIRSRLTL